MDRKLLDLLVCPATRQPVALLDSRGLEALNQAIAGGTKGSVDSRGAMPRRGRQGDSARWIEEDRGSRLP